ncbi:MAG: DUF559 domain-containing protein [Candidatus Gracilibacteria bacterium]|nr:DUF559 domain-containing protein [Candidatus Gracilibacteria bacterium]
MKYKINKKMKTPEIILEASRKLRKNMTESEVILWGFIKSGKLGVKFLRQKPLYLYTENSGLDRFIIPDFICVENKIILEIDGSIHDIDEIFKLDLYKEGLLKKIGYKVIRIKNDEIKKNTYKVINMIKTYL